MSDQALTQYLKQRVETLKERCSRYLRLTNFLHMKYPEIYKEFKESELLK